MQFTSLILDFWICLAFSVLVVFFAIWLAEMNKKEVKGDRQSLAIVAQMRITAIIGLVASVAFVACVIFATGWGLPAFGMIATIVVGLMTLLATHYCYDVKTVKRLSIGSALAVAVLFASMVLVFVGCSSVQQMSIGIEKRELVEHVDLNGKKFLAMRYFYENGEEPPIYSCQFVKSDNEVSNTCYFDTKQVVILADSEESEDAYVLGSVRALAYEDPIFHGPMFPNLKTTTFKPNQLYVHKSEIWSIKGDEDIRALKDAQQENANITPAEPAENTESAL